MILFDKPKPFYRRRIFIECYAYKHYNDIKCGKIHITLNIIRSTFFQIPIPCDISNSHQEKRPWIRGWIRIWCHYEKGRLFKKTANQFATMARLSSLFKPGFFFKFFYISGFVSTFYCFLDLMLDIFTGIFRVLMILKLDFVCFKIVGRPNFF